jgi:hypothetical protein
MAKRARLRTVTELLPVIEGTSRDVENWVGRLELRTRYADTVQGKARLYTRPNALELAFLSAFVRIGIRPRSAVAFAEACLEEHQRGKLPEWFAFRAGDLHTALPVADSDNLKDLRRDFGRAPVALVPVGEIARAVEALYSDQPTTVNLP